MERNWQIAKIYCHGCNLWVNLHHEKCPQDEFDTLFFIDINNFQFGCNKCNMTWPLEDGVTYCPSGHMQKTRYVDSKIIKEYGDKVIAKDGNLEYVLKRTGTVVVGRRDYLDLSFETKTSNKKWNYCAAKHDSCSLPLVCVNHAPHKCNRPHYCVKPNCSCRRPKGCANLNHNCSLPKIYVPPTADGLFVGLRNRLWAMLNSGGQINHYYRGR